MLNNIYKLKLFNFIFEVYNVTSTNSVNPTFIIITDVYPNVLFYGLQVLMKIHSIILCRSKNKGLLLTNTFFQYFYS